MHAVFKFLYSEIRGLHQSAYLLAIFTLASQILGLFRDRIFAHQFGAGSELDIYYAAFRIPDILFVLCASMLSVYVLVPFISEYTDRGDEEGARTLLSSVLSAFLVGYAVLALLCIFFAPAIVRMVFPGFVVEEQQTVVNLMRILLLQPLLLGLSGLASVITQLGQRFVIYAIAPLLYNGGIIVGALVFYPVYGLNGIAYGVVLGAFLHLLVQMPLVVASAYRPNVVIPNPRMLGRVLVQSLPRALTLSLNQIVLLAFVGIATVMSKGSVSILQFAYNLQSVPLSIVGVSYSVAAFPLLAHLFAKGEHSAFVARVEAALRHIAFWTIPIVGLIVVVRAQLVRVLLGSGAFDWNDTRLTAAALALFSFSLIAQAVSLLLVRAFYAGGNTRIPFRAALLSTCATLVLALVGYIAFVMHTGFRGVLENVLRLEGVPGTEIIVLPLAFSIVQLAHAGYLLYIFERMHGLNFRFTAVGQSLLATLGGSLVAYIILNTVVSGIRTDTFMGIFLQGALSGLAGVGTIVWLLWYMQNEELLELWSAMRRWRIMERILGPDSLDTLAH